MNAPGIIVMYTAYEAQTAGAEGPPAGLDHSRQRNLSCFSYSRNDIDEDPAETPRL